MKQRTPKSRILMFKRNDKWAKKLKELSDTEWIKDLSELALYKDRRGIYIVQLAGIDEPVPGIEIFRATSLRGTLKRNTFRMIVKKGKELKFGNLNNMANEKFKALAEMFCEILSTTELEKSHDTETPVRNKEVLLKWGEEQRQEMVKRELDEKKKRQEKLEADLLEIESMPSFDDLLQTLKKTSRPKQATQSPI